MKPAPIEVRGRVGAPLGMAPAAFLRDYWGKRPLLVRGALADFECPLTPDDLAGLACIEGSLGRIVRHDRRRDRWHLETGPFAEERFAILGRRDWTLLVQDVDRWDPEVRALLRLVDFLPRWRIDDVMVSYAVAGGSVGAHVDQYDVFLLQGMGQRRWQIDARPGAPLDFREDAPIRLLKRFEASHDWVLQPGDILYLPPRVPHFGEALCECLTFSLGMRAPSSAELLAAFAAQQAQELDESRRYADPDLRIATDPSEIDATTVRRVRRALMDVLALDDATLADWFGRFMSVYRTATLPRRRRIHASVIVERLARGATLVSSQSVRLNWSRAGKGARLHANAQTLAIDAALASRLCAADARIDGGQFAKLTEVDRDALVECVRRGWLEFA
ncbi:MAG: cupin domain-containing protein [Xanthomonadales bacterium]|nr:hypothetical protein [Xanthomonadales bacterium]MCC6594461.1 cupin domain-containing protein [Xanthomonadales bacterium]MCE7932424.1 cupin domain-containing protein [Xanthomonadales bacterium PRO6]